MPQLSLIANGESPQNPAECKISHQTETGTAVKEEVEAGGLVKASGESTTSRTGSKELPLLFRPKVPMLHLEKSPVEQGNQMILIYLIL